MLKLTKKASTSPKSRPEHIVETEDRAKHLYTPRFQYDDSFVCEERMQSYTECCNS